MRRLLILAFVTVSCLTSPTGMASGASPENGTIVRVELELKADHGLHAQLETSDKKMVTLTLERKNQIVTYEVRGQVNQQGLKVRLGRLGLIDVVFAPTRTLSATEPSEGCTGEPRTLREGVFTGTIEFTGEREYVRIEGPQAEGSMSVISQWQCPEGEELAPFAGISRQLARSTRGERRSASLIAASHRCSCAFFAGLHRDEKRWRSIFLAAKSERREGMEITRGALASAGASAFVVDHEAGTATLRPPQPFSGQATYRRRPKARELWRSTIRAPLLGAKPLKPDGPGFSVDLLPAFLFD